MTPHYFPTNSWYHNRISLDICIKRMVVIIMWTDIFLTSCSIVWLVRPAYFVGCCVIWKYVARVLRNTHEKHTILYALYLHTQNPQPILPSATQSVVCRNEILRFRLWFFHLQHTFFMRCHSKNQSWVWIQAPMRAPKSVLTTRFII